MSEYMDGRNSRAGREKWQAVGTYAGKWPQQLK